MGNIISYLEKYADISLKEMSFNFVDNLVLCTLSYCQLQNIIPDNNIEAISVKHAAEIFYSGKDLSSLSQVEQILLKMSKGRRFSEAKLFNYINKFNTEKCLQFCAFHIAISDYTTFIAIRGTDDSVTGWHESFSLSYGLIPSHSEAVSYLNNTIEKNHLYRIGGHSKGGNLAEYAALMSPKNLQEQIIEIYSNDSPGFIQTFIDADNYAAISNKIIKIVPEFSIVGSIFKNIPPTLIVKSSKKNITSHDALTWLTENDHFITSKNTLFRSRIYSALFQKIINSLNFTQREKIIEYFFQILKEFKIEDITKLNTKLIIKYTLQHSFKTQIPYNRIIGKNKIR